MITFEYDNITVSVPESWADITLGVYEQVYADKPESARDRVGVVAKICGVDPAVLLAWPAEIFNLIVGHVLFIYENNPLPPSPNLEIDGLKYAVAVEDVLTLGEWVDAEEAQKDKARAISGTLAITCRPVGEDYDYTKNDARQALFAAQPVSKVLGVMAFFLQCKQTSERLTQVCGSLHKMADQLPRSSEILRSLGGGTRLLRIWQIIKFWYLTRLLRSRLRRYSRSYNTAKTRITPKMRSVS